MSLPPPRPQYWLLDRVAKLDRRIKAIEQEDQLVTSILDDNLVERVRLGQHDDGKYGIRVWDSNGVLVHDFTTQ